MSEEEKDEFLEDEEEAREKEFEKLNLACRRKNDYKYPGEEFCLDVDCPDDLRIFCYMKELERAAKARIRAKNNYYKDNNKKSIGYFCEKCGRMHYRGKIFKGHKKYGRTEDLIKLWTNEDELNLTLIEKHFFNKTWIDMDRYERNRYVIIANNMIAMREQRLEDYNNKMNDSIEHEHIEGEDEVHYVNYNDCVFKCAECPHFKLSQENEFKIKSSENIIDNEKVRRIQELYREWEQQYHDEPRIDAEHESMFLKNILNK